MALLAWILDCWTSRQENANCRKGRMHSNGSADRFSLRRNWQWPGLQTLHIHQRTGVMRLPHPHLPTPTHSRRPLAPTPPPKPPTLTPQRRAPTMDHGPPPRKTVRPTLLPTSMSKRRLAYRNAYNKGELASGFPDDPSELLSRPNSILDPSQTSPSHIRLESCRNAYINHHQTTSCVDMISPFPRPYSDLPHRNAAHDLYSYSLDVPQSGNPIYIRIYPFRLA